MPINANQQNLAMEAFRRRAGMGPDSSAGVAGANQVTTSNPLAPQAMARPGLSAPQPSTSMSQGGRDQLPKSQPGEAELILKALIKRLGTLSPQPNAQPQTA